MRQLMIGGFGVVASILMASGVARGANTTCSGLLTGTINGNVVVPVNASCTIDNAKISGNVNVKSGGSLEVNASAADTTIGGSVTGNHCNRIDVENFGLTHRLVIRGNLIIKNCTSGFDGCRADSTRIPPTSVLIGGNFICSGNDDTCVTDYCTIGKNLTCSDNSGGCAIPSTTVGGNVKADNNMGSGISVTNNAIGGKLECKDNASATGSANTVARTKTGQCAAF